MRHLRSRQTLARISAGMLLMAMGAIGCREAGPADASPDSAVAQPIARLTLSDTPLVTVGGRDERPDYQTVYNSGALRLADGQLVLADDATRELRFYDAAGTHVRTAGGEGSGPGEFNRLRTIARLRGDTIFAWDQVQSRSSLFSADGAHLRTAPLPALHEIRGTLQRRHPRHFAIGATMHALHSGWLVVEPQLEPNMERLSGTLAFQDTLVLYAIDPSGEQYRPIGSYPGPEWFFHDGSGRRLPFGEDLRLAAGDDAVYVGSTRDRTIRVVSPGSGQTIGSIQLPLKARAPSADDVEQLRSRSLGRMRPELRGRVTAYLDAVPWPDSMPLYSDLRVAADGRLWVQAYRAPTDELQEWLILEPAGRHVASVSIDPSAKVMDAGADFVVVRVTDEMDLQEIRVYGLAQER